MNHSSFTISAQVAGAVFLIDNDVGKSITNDAEFVVSNINADFPNSRIFYKDTMDNWDELVHNRGTFLRFAGISSATKEKLKQYFV